MDTTRQDQNADTVSFSYRRAYKHAYIYIRTEHHHSRQHTPLHVHIHIHNTSLGTTDRQNSTGQKRTRTERREIYTKIKQEKNTGLVSITGLPSQDSHHRTPNKQTDRQAPRRSKHIYPNHKSTARKKDIKPTIKLKKESKTASHNPVTTASSVRRSSFVKIPSNPG